MKCVIVSAGGITDYGLMKEYIDDGDYILAVDAGYLHLEPLGVKAGFVLGDFDSLGYVPDEADEVVPGRKDDTDTMLAVRHGLLRGMDEFVILGGLGGRLDHTVANFAALDYLRTHGAKGMLADENTVVRLFGPGDEIQPVLWGPDSYFSVFPYGCPYSVISMSGVEYPTERRIFDCAFPLGVSNHVTDHEKFRMTVHEGKALVIECGGRLL